MKLNEAKYQKFSVEQLIEIGKHYFDNPEISLMHATEDNQWFDGDADGLAYANAHVSRKGLQVFPITRAMVEYKPEEVKKEAKPKEVKPKEDPPELTAEQIEAQKVADEAEVKDLTEKLGKLNVKIIQGTGLKKLRSKLALAEVMKQLDDAKIPYDPKAKINALKKLLPK